MAQDAADERSTEQFYFLVLLGQCDFQFALGFRFVCVLQSSLQWRAADERHDEGYLGFCATLSLVNSSSCFFRMSGARFCTSQG